MPAERFFLEKSFLKGEQSTLEGVEHHHLVHVMRGEAGDEVELINGQGQLAKAKILSISKRNVSLTLLDVMTEPKPPFEVILAQALPRINRLDFIVEKGTELGMTKLWLFPGDHSERKSLTEHQVERMRSVIISAMKQCGRLHMPSLEILPELKKWNGLDYPSFFGDVSPSALTFAEAWKEQNPTEGVIFFIGPESGFSEKEAIQLKALKATGVKLHHNILRTDTASLAALSLISHWRCCINNHRDQ